MLRVQLVCDVREAVSRLVRQSLLEPVRRVVVQLSVLAMPSLFGQALRPVTPQTEQGQVL